jgi:hypothetical protein
MKKGLIAVLGTIVFALAGLANANAPFFPNGIPDICIGDGEDGPLGDGGLTVDLNWFVYYNAFNLLEWVSDSDDPDAAAGGLQRGNVDR